VTFGPLSRVILLARTYCDWSIQSTPARRMLWSAFARRAKAAAPMLFTGCGWHALIRNAIDAAAPWRPHHGVCADTARRGYLRSGGGFGMDEKTLNGSYSSSAEIQDDGVRMVVEGYTAGLRPDTAISHRFPLSRAGEAIAFASEPHPAFHEIMIEPEANARRNLRNRAMATGMQAAVALRQGRCPDRGRGAAFARSGRDRPCASTPP